MGKVYWVKDRMLQSLSYILLNEMKIIWMAVSHNHVQVLRLPLHNLAVVAPVHHQIVEQVSLSILGAGSPGTHKIIKSVRSVPQLIVLPQSSPVPGEIKDLL